MHWRRWQELTLPKRIGGMGFRDVKHFNIAMLGKQGWRLMTAPNTLCARVLKGKYFRNDDFLNTKIRGISRTHGEQSWLVVRPWSAASFAELGMGKQQIFGEIAGYRVPLAVNLFVRDLGLRLCGFVSC